MSKAYAENFKLIDWSGFKPTPRQPMIPMPRAGSPHYMPDIAPFQSPLSGKMISSRTQLRHEERGYGVKQCGELNKVSDFDNSKVAPRLNERALESAFSKALDKTGWR